MAPVDKRPLKIPLIVWMVLLWWTAYSVMFASQVVAMGDTDGKPIAWSRALHFSFGGWMTWVPFSLGILWLVRRFPVERGAVLRALAVQSLGVAAIIILKAAYVYVTDPVFEWYDVLPGFGEVLITSVRNNLMTAWTVIGVAHAFVYYERAREREKRIADIEKSLVSTRLEALRAQVNPHFLFNALNSVAEMVHVDRDLADRMLVSLSALLRDGLKQDEVQERPLRDELAVVDHYLMIEKIRLTSRLQVRRQIDPDCLDVRVPVLILQPLVENAIVHGIARRRSPGWLLIRAEVTDGLLRLAVENSIEPGAATVAGHGVGLRSVSGRLQLLYGARARLLQPDAAPDRYVVELEVPMSVAMEKAGASPLERVA